VKLRDPRQTGVVVEKIQALLPGYPVYPIEEFLTLATADIQEVSRQVTDAIVGIAVIIGFIVVLLSMYTSVIERTREIGILKSLGASKGYIVGIFLREALLLCAAGIVAGFGLSYLVRSIVIDRFPLLSVLISAEWLVMSAALAVIGATLGSLYPAIRAARQDTIQSLTYD
jgi:putative ABC transport system permease protein